MKPENKKNVVQIRTKVRVRITFFIEQVTSAGRGKPPAIVGERSSQPPYNPIRDGEALLGGFLQRCAELLRAAEQTV